ncbi:MAG: nitroreductase family protein [Thermoleophilia bacterium]
MNFEDLAKHRYSVRSYQDRDVEDEKLAKILEAARLAPTAANRQPFRLVVVRDPDTRAALSEAYMRKWFYTAPVVIAACGVPGESWVRSDGANYTMVDVAIVMDHLILQAADLGLGTCWIADFKPEPVRRILHLPPGVEPVALTPLGYPADEAKPKKRRPAEELVYWDRYVTGA